MRELLSHLVSMPPPEVGPERRIFRRQSAFIRFCCALHPVLNFFWGGLGVLNCWSWLGNRFLNSCLPRNYGSQFFCFASAVKHSIPG
jgi:hypothetical protein